MARPRVLVAMAAIGCMVAACGAPSPTPVPAALHVENRTGDTFVFEIEPRGSDGTPAYAIGLPACGGAWDIPWAAGGVPNDGWLVWALVADDGDIGPLIPAGPLEDDGTPPVGSMSIAWSTGEMGPADLPRAITIRPEGVAVTAARDASPTAAGCEPWIGDG